MQVVSLFFWDKYNIFISLCGYNFKGTMLTVVVMLCMVSVSAHLCKIKNNTEVIIANCSRKNLTSVPQDLPGDIEVLNMDHNHLSILENGKFSVYTKLRNLTMNWNNISMLDYNSFYGLSNLRTLEMSGNVIDFSVYHPQVFEPISNLTILDISKTNNVSNHTKPIHYPDGALEVLVKLRNLSIDLAPIPLFGKGFTKLKELRSLTFSNCYVQQIANSTFENFSSGIENLHMTDCNHHFILTETGALRPFRSLKVLDLSHSFLHPIQAFILLHPLQNSNMSSIIFRHINDESVSTDQEYPFELTITQEMVKYLRTICLEKFDISDNNIIDFDNGSLFAFDRVECLEEINLSRNRISFSKGYRMDNIRNFFHDAINLKVIDYSYIPLSFPNLQKNRSNLSIGPDRVIKLPKSVKIVRMSHVMHGGDPWLWVLPSNNTIKEYDVSFSVTVDQANLSRGSQINELDVSGINAWIVYIQLKSYPLTQLLTIIMQHTNLYLIIQSNKNIFQYIKGAENVDISYNFLYEIKNDTFQNMTNLRNLSLSNNLLRAIPSAVLNVSSLEILDLSNNLISRIDENDINYFKVQVQKLKHPFKLNLRNNAFVCDCSNKEFIRWMYTDNTNITLDSDTYKCILENTSESDTKSVYLRFHDHFAHCESTLWLKFAVVLLTSFFAGFLPFSIIYNFRWRITFFFYAKFRKALEKGIQVNFKYDIFVFYNDDVLDWLNETFLPQVEHKWGLKVCIEHRDFAVGQPIAEAIAEAIEQSRHIVIIVTSSFASNRWGKYTIERAKYHHFTQNLQKIIVISKDFNTDEMPHELTVLWKDITLVEWPLNVSEVDNFWNKMKVWVFLNHTN